MVMVDPERISNKTTYAMSPMLGHEYSWKWKRKRSVLRVSSVHHGNEGDATGDSALLSHRAHNNIY
jgi:hypothetical protein